MYIYDKYNELNLSKCIFLLFYYVINIMKQIVFTFTVLVFMLSQIYGDATYLQDKMGNRGQLIFGNGGGFEFCSPVPAEGGDKISLIQVINISNEARTNPCTKIKDDSSYRAKALDVPNNAYFIDDNQYRRFSVDPSYYILTQSELSSYLDNSKNLLYNVNLDVEYLGDEKSIHSDYNTLQPHFSTFDPPITSYGGSTAGSVDVTQVTPAYYKYLQPCKSNQLYGCYTPDIFAGVTTNLTSFRVKNDSFTFDHIKHPFGLTIGDFAAAMAIIDVTSSANLVNVLTFRRDEEKKENTLDRIYLNPSGPGVVMGAVNSSFSDPILGVYTSSNAGASVGIGTKSPIEALTVRGNLYVKGDLQARFGIFDDTRYSDSKCENDYIHADQTGTAKTLGVVEFSPLVITHNIMAFADVTLFHKGDVLFLLDLIDPDEQFPRTYSKFKTFNNSAAFSEYDPTIFFPSKGNGDYVDSSFGGDYEENIVKRSRIHYNNLYEDDTTNQNASFHLSNTLVQEVPKVDCVNGVCNSYQVISKLLCSNIKNINLIYEDDEISGVRGYKPPPNIPDPGLRLEIKERPDVNTWNDGGNADWKSNNKTRPGYASNFTQMLEAWDAGTAVTMDVLDGRTGCESKKFESPYFKFYPGVYTDIQFNIPIRAYLSYPKSDEELFWKDYRDFLTKDPLAPCISASNNVHGSRISAIHPYLELENDGTSDSYTHHPNDHNYILKWSGAVVAPKQQKYNFKVQSYGPVGIRIKRRKNEWVDLYSVQARDFRTDIQHYCEENGCTVGNVSTYDNTLLDYFFYQDFGCSSATCDFGANLDECKAKATNGGNYNDGSGNNVCDSLFPYQSWVDKHPNWEQTNIHSQSIPDGTYESGTYTLDNFCKYYQCTIQNSEGLWVSNWSSQSTSYCPWENGYASQASHCNNKYFYNNYPVAWGYWNVTSTDHYSCIYNNIIQYYYPNYNQYTGCSYYYTWCGYFPYSCHRCWWIWCWPSTCYSYRCQNYEWRDDGCVNQCNEVYNCRNYASTYDSSPFTGSGQVDANRTDLYLNPSNYGQNGCMEQNWVIKDRKDGSSPSYDTSKIYPSILNKKCPNGLNTYEQKCKDRMDAQNSSQNQKQLILSAYYNFITTQYGGYIWERDNQGQNIEWNVDGNNYKAGKAYDIEIYYARDIGIGYNATANSWGDRGYRYQQNPQRDRILLEYSYDGSGGPITSLIASDTENDLAFYEWNPEYAKPTFIDDAIIQFEDWTEVYEEDEYTKHLYLIGFPLGEIQTSLFNDEKKDFKSNTNLMTSLSNANITYLADNYLSLKGPDAQGTGVVVSDIGNRILFRDTEGSLVPFRSGALSAANIYERQSVSIINDKLLSGDANYTFLVGSSGEPSLLFTPYTQEFKIVSTNIQAVNLNDVVANAGYSSFELKESSGVIYPKLSFPFGLDIGDGQFVVNGNFEPSDGDINVRGVAINKGVTNTSAGLDVKGNIVVSGTVNTNYAQMYYATCQTMNMCSFPSSEDLKITNFEVQSIPRKVNDSSTAIVTFKKNSTSDFTITLPPTIDSWDVYVYLNASVWSSSKHEEGGLGGWATAYISGQLGQSTLEYSPAVQYNFTNDHSFYPFVIRHKFSKQKSGNFTVKFYLHNRKTATSLILDPSLHNRPDHSGDKYQDELDSTFRETTKGSFFHNTTEFSITILAVPDASLFLSEN